MVVILVQRPVLVAMAWQHPKQVAKEALIKALTTHAPPLHVRNAMLPCLLLATVVQVILAVQAPSIQEDQELIRPMQVIEK